MLFEGDAVLQKINAWMRSKASYFDGLIDFDVASRHPADPSKMCADLQSGDWLDPNGAGYKVLADAVNLNLFKQPNA